MESLPPTEQANAQKTEVDVAWQEFMNVRRASADEILLRLDRYYRDHGIHPLDFDCPLRSQCAQGCSEFVEARASLIGPSYGARATPRIAFIAYERAEARTPSDQRTLEAARVREARDGIVGSRRQSQRLEIHELAAQILSRFLGGLKAEDAAGWFAKVNAAKCAPVIGGNLVLDPRLFRNCQPYLRGELTVLRPEIVVTLGRAAALSVEDISTTMLRRFDASCSVIDLSGRPTFWLRLRLPNLRDARYLEQKQDWAAYAEVAYEWFRGGI